MEDKNLVLKSKSSNNASTSKEPATNEPNKKTWSSARFRQVNSKKRSLYVEKKSSPSTFVPGPTDAPKPAPRPRRGQKQFLNNVLSILAQDTEATQFPENDTLATRTQKRLRPRLPKNTVDKSTQDMDALYTTNESRRRRQTPKQSRTTQPTKLRFRSKALSENFQDSGLVILQPKKECSAHTPSGHSGSYSKTIVQVRQVIEMPTPKIEVKEEEIQNSPEYDDAMTAITNDSKKNKRNKVLRIEEPETLVSNYSEKNKSLYNLFVDILETTFSVYNASDSEYNQNKTNAVEQTPKIESNPEKKVVINTQNNNNDNFNNNQMLVKTNINENNNPTATYFNGTPKPEHRKLYYVTDDGVTDKITVYQTRPKLYHMNPPAVPQYRMNYGFRFNNYGSNYYRSNLKQQSFRFAQQLKLEAAAKAEKLNKPQHKLHTKSFKKKNLLSILRAELKKDLESYEEPQTMHQALAVIARNKRRTARQLHFDERSVISSQPENSRSARRSECFKARKILSSSMKGTIKRRRPENQSFMTSIRSASRPRNCSVFPNQSYYNYSRRGNNEFNYNKEPSCHSIEVTGYDYEPNKYARQIDLEKKTILYAINSENTLKTESVSSKDNLDFATLDRATLDFTTLDCATLDCETKSKSFTMSRTSELSVGSQESSHISDLLINEDIYNLY